jgi:nucleotide-binding universal stress UspA family protein
MSNTIIVGVDGSETALKAAEVAARLAASTGARLHVVTAYKPAEGGVIAVGSDEFVYSSADTALGVAQVATTHIAADVDEVTAEAVPGKPQDVLIDEAKRLEAWLIVVGNRRMQGLGRMLGSIASDVAHHAPCDVYIAKTT